MYKLYHIAEDIKAIYNPDTLGLIYYKREFEKDIADALSGQNISKINNDLRASGFFDEINIDLSRPIRTLYFCTSYNCNLACKYCLTNESVSCGRSKAILSNEIIIKAIEQFTNLSVPKTEREVVFYGGEPTLYPNMLKFICDNVRRYEKNSHKNLKPARIILCTNGTLINESLARFIKDYGIYPAISIDGFPEIHDANRVTAKGEKSYVLVDKGYKLLHSYVDEIGITLALGKHTIDRLPEIVSYLNDKYHPKTIATNSMLDFENSSNTWMPDANKLPKKLWETFLVCRKENIYVVKIIMDNRVKPFVERKPRIRGCTGTGGRMCVLPDGNIVPCMALSHKYLKHIDSHPAIPDFTPEALLNASPFIQRKCKNCEAKSTCGGGCPATYILNDDALQEDSVGCSTSKYFLFKMIALLWYELDCREVIEKTGYYIPTMKDRKKVYGNLVVNSEVIDFQYIPHVETRN